MCVAISHFARTSGFSRPLEMTPTTCNNTSLRCFCASFSPSFEFPASSPPPNISLRRFGAKTPRAFSGTTAHEDCSDGNHFNPSYGRRRTVLITSLSFLFPPQEFTDARASQSDESLVIKEELRKVLSRAKAAGVLRLVFHDAGTYEMEDKSGGMNGSIIYELDRPENSGLNKSLKTIQKAKSEVDALQPVSWADMIAVAGAEAVSLCGGPTIPVRIGRIDSTMPDPEDRLPLESLGAFGLKQCFQRKGLSTQELVALSGAHTLGSKGFGSPIIFDNSYFKILLEKPWMSSGGMSKMIGLPSDRALVEDDECLRWIRKYAESQDIFFQDFKNAYVKLVNSGARWKSL